jgi:hypothetical protein
MRRLRDLSRALRPAAAAASAERDTLAQREQGPGARSGKAKEGYNVPNPLVGSRAQQIGVQGAHLNPLGLFLNPLGLFLRTSITFVWRILSAFLRA